MHLLDTPPLPPPPPRHRRYNRELIFLRVPRRRSFRFTRNVQNVSSIRLCARVRAYRLSEIIVFQSRLLCTKYHVQAAPASSPASSPDTEISLPLLPLPLHFQSCVSLREQLSRAPRLRAVLIIIFLYNSRNFSSLLPLIFLSLSLSFSFSPYPRIHPTRARYFALSPAS